MNTCFKSLAIVFLACVSSYAETITFTSYLPTNNWVSHSNEYFSINTPAGWTIKLHGTSDFPEHADSGWQYDLYDNSNKVCSIIIAVGGPEWLQCFCTPYYDEAIRENTKLWSCRLEDGDGLIFNRTLKGAKGNLRFDIHVSYGEYDKGMIDYMVESIRLNPKETQHIPPVGRGEAPRR